MKRRCNPPMGNRAFEHAMGPRPGIDYVYFARRQRREGRGPGAWYDGVQIIKEVLGLSRRTGRWVVRHGNSAGHGPWKESERTFEVEWKGPYAWVAKAAVTDLSDVRPTPRSNPESVRFDRIAPLNYKRLFPGEQWRVWIQAPAGSTKDVLPGARLTFDKRPYSKWKQDGHEVEAKGFADVFLDGDTLYLAYLWVDDAFRATKIGSRIVEAIYQHEPWKRVRYIVWGELHHDATRKMYRDFLVLDPRTCGGKMW